MDHFGDAQSIKKADNRHALLFQRQKSMLVSKKRYAEDFLSSDKAKMAKNFSEPGQSVMGAYPNAQSQWPAGYGQKAPVWPTTTQPQVQWNPGYASQVCYISFIWFLKSSALFLVPALLSIMGCAAMASL